MKLLAYEKDHLEKLRAHLAECAVLLKSNGDFPLEEPGRLALYGAGARHTVKGGTGSGEVNSRFFVTVEQGLRAAGFTLTTDAWLDAYDAALDEARERFVQEIRARAKQHHTFSVLEAMGKVMPEPEYAFPLDGAGDTAVYVLSRVCGEGGDRTAVGGDVLLSGPEVRDILALSAKYRRFMLVLNVGGVVDLSPVLGAVENILVLSQLGAETGAVLADLLLGRAYPSGKLTASWAAWGDYPAVGSFGEAYETRYREGVYVGYRYFDSANVAPLFPFGFGLGYTTFAVTPLETRASGETITLRAAVRNTGARSGKETVQLYASPPQGTLDQPFQSLAAFAKTDELPPRGETELTLSFRLSDLASFDAARCAYVLEGGDYVLRVGTSSRDAAPCALLRLTADVTVRTVRHAVEPCGFVDWRPPHRPAEALADGLPVVTVAAEDIPRQTVSYELPARIEPEADALSDEELMLLGIGAFDPRSRLPRLSGDSAQSVAGAAGETCGLLRERGVPALVLSDGPAGLRLSRDFFRDARGVHGIGMPYPESVTAFLGAPLKALLDLTAKKPRRGTEIEHQYCTAIPIGTAIAQSWNTAFAELCGDVVGAEMERFGVQLWLAPALNIQRDIRCGRNFEYFSEDPLVSGEFAAALVRGVQAHPGCGATVKHCAANNQETNRHDNNSLVSERALRELYLRGFERCIRDARPCALMTSYNLLNGVHTAQSRALISDVLRAEFGFDGVVMTDWFVDGMTRTKHSHYPAPDAGAAAAAGSSLMMPGSVRDLKDMRAALERGTLTRRQLSGNASYLLRLIRRLLP